VVDGENTERGAERTTLILPRIHPNGGCGRKSFKFRSRICEAFRDGAELPDRIGWRWLLLLVHAVVLVELVLLLLLGGKPSALVCDG
jgi:hypothetical protein